MVSGRISDQPLATGYCNKTATLVIDLCESQCQRFMSVIFQSCITVQVRWACALAGSLIRLPTLRVISAGATTAPRDHHYKRLSNFMFFYIWHVNCATFMVIPADYTNARLGIKMKDREFYRQLFIDAHNPCPKSQLVNLFRYTTQYTGK